MLQDAGLFLVRVLFELAASAFWLRFYMQWATSPAPSGRWAAVTAPVLLQLCAAARAATACSATRSTH